jgi:hypothetical protein
MFQLAIVCPRCRHRFVALDALDDTCHFRCPSCDELALHIQRIAGYVYILSNETMPGLMKIGFTERTVAERISELSAHTGVPSPYKEEASFPVAEPSKIERLIHDSLSPYRHREDREFFRLSPGEATAHVRKILGIAVEPPRSSTGVPKSPPPVPPLPRGQENLGGFGSQRYEKRG